MTNQTKKYIKNGIFRFLSISRSYTLFNQFSGIGHILMFHSVRPTNIMKKYPFDSDLEVSPEYLEAVIRFFIEHNYIIISLDQLCDILQNSKKLDKKFIVVTFDDGYADNYFYAYPILKKYNAPFTIYVTTGFVDRSAIMWWHLLGDIVASNKAITFQLRRQVFQFDCSNFFGKKEAFYKISSLITNSDENQHLDVLKAIFDPYGVDLYKITDELSLTWKQIQSLSNDPLVTIGAHTISHYALGRISKNAAMQEMRGSKETLEKYISKSVKHFSYPNGGKGDADLREFDAAKNCGFDTATTTRPANIFYNHCNFLHSLPRINMAENMEKNGLLFVAEGFLHFRNNGFKKVITL